MNWKSWPYWVKGGVITGFIQPATVSFLVVMWLGVSGFLDPFALFTRDGGLFSVFDLIIIPFVASGFKIPMSISHIFFGSNFPVSVNNEIINTSIQVIFGGIVNFGAGALFGYLYGKVKNRKQLST